LISSAANVLPSAAPEGGKARRTYEALLRACGEELAATGSFSAERVAARSGTSPATFYAYLGSKDAALAAVFSRALDRLVEVVERELSVERLLERGLPRLCRDFAAAAAAYFGEQSLVFRCALARLPGSRALREVYRAHERVVFERYRRFLELGRAAGKLRDAEPAGLAQALLVVTEGLNNPLVVGRGPDDPLVVELGDVVCRLLAPRA